MADRYIFQAKDKEQAALHLYRIYGLESVTVGSSHPSVRDPSLIRNSLASLRPPTENPTMQTNGRKSNKKAKKIRDAAKALENEDGDEDGHVCEDETVHIEDLDNSADSPLAAQTPGKERQEQMPRLASGSTRSLRTRTKALRGDTVVSGSDAEEIDSKPSPKKPQAKRRKKEVDDEDFLPRLD